MCDLLSCGPHSLTAANNFSKEMSLNNDKTLENVMDFIFHIKAEAVKKKTALVYQCCLKAIQSI